MKVILLQDVKTVGKKGEIVEVSDAYARNVLLKKGQGKEATGKNINDLKLHRANEEKLAQAALDSARELAEKLKGRQVEIAVKTGEKGRVFGSVSSKEIAEEIKAQLGYEVDRKKIQLASPIRDLGVTLVSVKLHPKVSAEIGVNVVEA